MTMKDVRSFSWLISDWCVCQDDLTGFVIHLEPGIMKVTLEWEGGYKIRYAFTQVSLQNIYEPSCITDALHELAERARAEIAAKARFAKRTDPNRLPG